ncbi:hypothetical protein D3C74_30500 [compost metagenome]
MQAEINCLKPCIPCTTHESCSQSYLGQAITDMIKNYLKSGMVDDRFVKRKRAPEIVILNYSESQNIP